MNIHPEDIDIENLLGNKFFTIPQFQRPYSWEGEQLSEFWEDLLEQVQELELDHKNTKIGHFFGSMVVYTVDKKAVGVVDGQQRLTTLTILLCVIRDQYDELGENDSADGLHRLIQREDIRNKTKFVLYSETTTPYLQDAIQTRGEAKDEYVQPTREENRIQNTYNYFKENLNRELSSCEDDATKVSKLTKVLDAILNSRVILITLDNISDAYTIFETLNTRGLELSYSDLLKNYLLKMIGDDEGYDYFNKGWNGILADLRSVAEKEVNIDEYLYHYWNSRFKYSTKKNLYSAVKRHINDNPKRAEDLFKDLRKNAKFYVVICSSDSGQSLDRRIPVKMQDSLKAISLFKVKQAHSALLALMRAYQFGIIKESQACVAFRNIEIFHFIFTAITSSRSSGGIQSRYCLFAREIESCLQNMSKERKNKVTSDVLKEIELLREKLLNALPERAEFETGFRKIRYSKSTAQLIRYILNNIRAHFGTASKHDSSMTIEHIIPRSWSGKTAKELKIEPSSPNYFEGIMPSEVVDSIGNLVLINKDLNNKLGNLSFEEKRECLKKAGIFSDDTFPDGSEDGWTFEKVESRTANIVNLSWEQVWSL